MNCSHLPGKMQSPDQKFGYSMIFVTPGLEGRTVSNAFNEALFDSTTVLK